jgi:hypothetical protein
MSTSKDESKKQMALASICAFGKAAATYDDRDLKLADIRLARDPLPEAYDFDDRHKGIANQTYQNPPQNNCVIAGRAHHTLRFELAEQKVLINITDNDVEREFKKQTTGDRTDIDVRPSLDLWRTHGWEAAGQHFKIKAFSKIDPIDAEDIKRMIYINLGVGLGFQLPESAIQQFKDGQPWGVTRDRAANHSHYVYVPGYTKDGPVCVTWGRKQHMSWAFVDKYCDEAWAIIDDVDTPEKKRTLDEEKINKFLKTRAPVSAEADRISPP